MKCSLVTTLKLLGVLVIVFSEPPGPIDNSKIGVMKGGHIQLKQSKQYMLLHVSIGRSVWVRDPVCIGLGLCVFTCMC